MIRYDMTHSKTVSHTNPYIFASDHVVRMNQKKKNAKLQT